MLLILLIILGFGVEFPQLHLNDFETVNLQAYWPMLLVSCTFTSWKRPTSNALAEFENWLKANKHTKLNKMCHTQ